MEQCELSYHSFPVDFTIHPFLIEAIFICPVLAIMLRPTTIPNLHLNLSGIDVYILPHYQTRHHYLFSVYEYELWR